MKKLIAFNGKKETKDFYLNRVREHRLADEIVKGQYWEGGKGCAVGCTLHSNRHADYPKLLGIPEVLAKLQDGIFEGLPNDLAVTWPERFYEAIEVGADLSMVWPKFAHWLLTDPEHGIIKYSNKPEAITGVADLYKIWITGEKPKKEEWVQARRGDAAYAAAYAAYAAAYAAAAAYDADSAADYAAYAADAAAAYGKSKENARVVQSEKLLQLFRECK
jgi:hypothetical protein